MQYRPLATVIEGAKVIGKATGLVATSRITHATPAAFAAHVHHRELENEIMEHIVYNDVDVAFGGGRRHLVPTTQGGKRTDGENLQQALIGRGYQFVQTRDQMLGLSSGKAWGMFASSHMQAHIDRAQFGPNEPSLAEMTDKAIDLLSQDPDGFFLMVEGSQVDWAGHADDPIYMITDFLAFDDAFKVAVDFAIQHGNTLVMAFPDHNTGGLSIGNTSTDNSYTNLTFEELVNPLKGMKLTAYGVALKIGSDTSNANIIAKVKEWWGLDITDADVEEIKAGVSTHGESLDYAMSRVLSAKYTVFGWTTHGHVGQDVPLWSYGPQRPVGGLDNTQLAQTAARAMGFDLDTISVYLYADVASYFPGYKLDTSDTANPVIKVGTTAMPVSKDYLMIDGMGSAGIPMPGLAVHARVTSKCYVPLTAIAFMQAFGTKTVSRATLRSGPAKSRLRGEVRQRLELLLSELGVDPGFPSRLP